MHALPYDWRVGIIESNFNDIFEKLLDRSLEITGKKAIVTAHSLGTMYSHYYFSLDDQ